MPSVVGVPLLKVRQGPWTGVALVRNAADARPYRRFNPLGQAAIGVQVVAADHDVPSRPSPGHRRVEVDFDPTHDRTEAPDANSAS